MRKSAENSKQPPSGPVRSALVGVIFGVDAAALCLALATTCFSGALVAGLGLATGVFLFGTVLTTMAIYLFGGLRLPFAISQDTTISILAPAVILAATAVNGPIEAKVATALAVIGASAILSGLVFWGIGQLGLGRLVRMFPYPVAAGFLASSGYLLVYTAVAILTGKSTSIEMLLAAGDPLVQLRLVPAVVMALAMFISLRVWAGSLPVLVVVLSAIFVFYVATAALGVSSESAVELGLLPRVDEQESGVFSLAMFGMIDWWAVVWAAPVIFAVVLLNLIGMLLNTSGVELATRDDVDENRELRVTGIANLLAGLVGSLTCYLQSGASIIAAKLGVQTKPTLFGHNAVLLVACGLAPIIVAAVPTFVPAALLIFIGLSMIEDWLIDTRRRLIRSDWLIVLSIVLATAVFGSLPAIAIGLGLALLLFAYATIRLPVIRHTTSAAKRSSVRDRNTLHVETLIREGHRIRIMHLQGSLFFGSIDQLMSRIRELFDVDPAIRAVIIDFAEVKSIDSSACAAMEKLTHLLETHSIEAHLSSVPPALLDVFKRWGLPVLEGGAAKAKTAFQLWPSLDQALEHCESALLAEIGQNGGQKSIELMLSELGRKHKRCHDLIQFMEKKILAPGEMLISATHKAADVFFVVSGQLGVHLPAGSGQSLRVRSLGPGSIVGEVAYLTGQPRNADVICEEPTEVLKLTEASIRRIEAKDRDLAALLMSIFTRALAAKLAQTNALLTNNQTSKSR